MRIVHTNIDASAATARRMAALLDTAADVAQDKRVAEALRALAEGVRDSRTVADGTLATVTLGEARGQGLKLPDDRCVPVGEALDTALGMSAPGSRVSHLFISMVVVRPARRKAGA